MDNAVVLLSGGLDSSTCLALALADGYRAHALSIAYGQRHAVELQAARAVARQLGAASHRELTLDLGLFGGSALTDRRLGVPRDRPLDTGGIPLTYVPARNAIFLALAAAWAEVLPADHIYVGVSAVDYSGYPDCRPAFVAAFERMANLAGARWVDGHRRLVIHAPLAERSKAEAIALGLRHGLDYGLTHSCYDPLPDGAACGGCDACRLRARAFAQAGVPDPTRYGPRVSG